jgi:peptide deformylase
MADEIEHLSGNGLEPETAGQERPPADPAVEARRLVALSFVRTFGDPALRSRSLDVTRFDDRLVEEVARMARIMDDALGVGLAATQLGIMHRLLVYRTGIGHPLVAVVNPALEWASSEVEAGEEGCLSLPGVLVEVERPAHVRVSARDQWGEEISIEASGLDARVIQHEIDHLDGVLILDRTTREARKEAMRVLREGVAVPDGATAAGDRVASATGAE